MGPAENPTGKPMINSPGGYSPPYIFLGVNAGLPAFSESTKTAKREQGDRGDQIPMYVITCKYHGDKYT